LRGHKLPFLSPPSFSDPQQSSPPISHVILAHQVSSEGEEGDQEEEHNPNIDAHQARLS
jgi:hypothetical protein